MIDIKSLKEADKGSWVVVDNTNIGEATGRIKSWNDTYIFVVFHCNGDWENYADYTAEAVNPSRIKIMY